MMRELRERLLCPGAVLRSNYPITKMRRLLKMRQNDNEKQICPIPGPQG